MTHDIYERSDEPTPATRVPETCIPETWTPEHVGRRLVEAFRTLDRLPRVAGPRQTGNHWPRHRVEWGDRIAQAELPAEERQAREHRRNTLIVPSGVEIDRMDRALDWLCDLRALDPGLALVTSSWALRAARRRSVRALCRERSWAPGTFYKLRAKALDHLAATLKGSGTTVF